MNTFDLEGELSI